MSDLSRILEIFIPAEMESDLSERASLEGRSVGEIIRQALFNYLYKPQQGDNNE